MMPLRDTDNWQIKTAVRRRTAAVLGTVCAYRPFANAVCWRRRCRKVAVTFDDGPNSEFTPEVLSILASFRVKATFFVLGNAVENNSDVLQTIIADGHDIGIHGYDHSGTKLREQVLRCEQILNRFGQSTRLFRPPRGEIGPVLLAWLIRHGFTTVLWSFDVRDSMRAEKRWSGPDPDFEQIQSGDIILMHDDNSLCIRELPVLLESLSSRSLEFGTVNALIGNR